MKLQLLLLVIFSFSLLSSINVQADWRSDKRQENRQDNRQDDRRNNKFVRTPVVRKKAVFIVPRKRSFRNIVIIRPFGHTYQGYGRFYHDNDAWKWLAFTRITLKILDNINEQAQRAHENAQIIATTSAIGEKITWSEGNATGSVVATKQGINSSGLTCREFQQTITVGGNVENAYGTACLQADGAWKIVQ